MIFEFLLFVGNIATYFFLWSYKIGKFIVSVICFIARSLYVSTEKFVYLLRILGGDFELFIQDVSRTIINIVNSVSEACNNYLKIIDQVFEFVKEYLLLVGYGIGNFFIAVYLCLKNIVIFIDDFVKLLGPALWFLVTLPYSLFQLGLHCIYYLKNKLYELPIEVHKILKNIHTNPVEVSVETIARLICLLVFVYLLILFRKVIAKICKKSILFLFSFLNLNITKLPLSVLRIICTKSNPSSNVTREVINDSHICIICQTNPRSIVLLPCRHLCLCDICCSKLARYGTNNCPVCRQETDLKLRVYL